MNGWRLVVSCVATVHINDVTAGAAGSPAHIIIDTDMSTDVDDVGALCLAHSLQSAGEAVIEAVVHNAGFAGGAGAVSAINHWFNRDSIPIGSYAGGVGAFNSSYVDELVSRFPGPIKRANEAPSAVRVYRSTLAAANASSITIASIGFVTNLHALLASTADELSPLSGLALVATKVMRLVMMGGHYSGGMRRSEWNFGGLGIGGTIGRITNETLERWPPSVPVTFLGFEVGVGVQSGSSLRHAPDGPCRAAYELWCKATPKGCSTNGGRSSWDPMTVLLAVRAEQPDLYLLHKGGHNRVDPKTGNNTWSSTPPSGGDSQQGYLVLKPDAGLRAARELNALLCPANGTSNT